MIRKDFANVQWRISQCKTGWLVIRGEAMPFSESTWHFAKRHEAADFVRDGVDAELMAFRAELDSADLAAIGRALNKV